MQAGCIQLAAKTRGSALSAANIFLREVILNFDR